MTILFLATTVILESHNKGPLLLTTEGMTGLSAAMPITPRRLGKPQKSQELRVPVPSFIYLGDLMASGMMFHFPTVSFRVGSFTKTLKGQKSYSELVTMSQRSSFLCLQAVV